jgi:hypothetical protein
VKTSQPVGLCIHGIAEALCLIKDSPVATSLEVAGNIKTIIIVVMSFHV